MSDDSQILIPESFTVLYVPRGRVRPTAARQEIAERYEFCEDLAHMLEDQAKAVLFDLGISEDDVLERIQAGLCGGAASVTPGEAWWVTRRLAELLGWDGSRLAPPPDGA